MRNKKTSKWEKRGLYIAICCCAGIIAAVGYVGNKNEQGFDNNSSEEIALSDTNYEYYEEYDSEYVSDDIIITQTDADAEIIEDKDTETAVKNSETDVSLTVSENTENKVENENKNITSLEDIKFSMPVEGKVIYEFSGDKLVYNEILSDWRSHNGIDISCEKDAAIYSAANGIISDIYNDSLGKNVVVDHQNGYKTVYANLSEQIEVTVGEEILTGGLIGKVGSTALSDFSQDSHLHFEIVYNEEYVNPVDYLE